MGTFFKNAWNNIKSWYGSNAEKLKSITDILVNSENMMIDKGEQYVGDKTGSDSLKLIGTVVGNMAKNTVMQLVLFKTMVLDGMEAISSTLFTASFIRLVSFLTFSSRSLSFSGLLFCHLLGKSTSSIMDGKYGSFSLRDLNGQLSSIFPFVPWKALSRTARINALIGFIIVGNRLQSLQFVRIRVTLLS